MVGEDRVDGAVIASTSIAGPPKGGEPSVPELAQGDTRLRGVRGEVRRGALHAGVRPLRRGKEEVPSVESP